MSKLLVVVVLALLVLTSAMGLKALSGPTLANTTAPVPPTPWMLANTTAPVPPTPWMNTTAPVPPTPWANTTAPVPPTPWR
jgi:hypothetical protein